MILACLYFNFNRTYIVEIKISIVPILEMHGLKLFIVLHCTKCTHSLPGTLRLAKTRPY